MHVIILQSMSCDNATTHGNVRCVALSTIVCVRACTHFRLLTHHTLATKHFALFQRSINVMGAGNSPTHFREFSNAEFAMISTKA